MTLPDKRQRRDAAAAPALSRLLADSAASRAALRACALPLAVIDAVNGAASVTFCNAAFERFFGYSECEALGAGLPALVFRGDPAPLLSLLGESAERVAAPAYAKDGSPRSVELSLGVVRNADGETSHWVVGFADCSEIERLRAELAAARALMRAAA